MRPVLACTVRLFFLFQSTHSRRVRLSDNAHVFSLSMFQSTHSRRVRHRTTYRCSLMNCFNPRTHEECDSVCHDVLATFIMFQSTHSRRVRHQHYLLHLRLNVSIHALTKSATGCIRTPSIRNGCFNPRTHEECDLAQSFRYRLRDSFNPRTHEECDKFLTASGQNKQVSIHALTKSATFSFNDFIGITKMFQSTHSRRVRHASDSYSPPFWLFQSTHSRRVRQEPC